MLGITHGVYFFWCRTAGPVYPVDDDNVGKFVQIVQGFGETAVKDNFRDDILAFASYRLLYFAPDDTDCFQVYVG